MGAALDAGKKEKGGVKKRPADIYNEKPLTRSKSSSVFREVAVGFLENCANCKDLFFNEDLLPSIKKDFDVEKDGIVEADYLRFFFVSSFFLEFHLIVNEVD